MHAKESFIKQIITCLIKIMAVQRTKRPRAAISAAIRLPIVFL